MANNQEIYGNALAKYGFGLILCAPSGYGKSLISHYLIKNYQYRLVADDRVVLNAQENFINLSAVQGFMGQMELRPMGIIQLPNHQYCQQASLIGMVSHHEQPERCQEFQGQQQDFFKFKIPNLFANFQDRFIGEIIDNYMNYLLANRNEKR